MRKNLTIELGATIAAATLLLVWPLTAAAPLANPEEVGLSSERLKRVPEFVQRYMASRSASGAVTLVARYGRIAHFEAHGVMDIETKKPMQKDAIFRIASMTKPVVAVSVLMLIEEGKLRLTDPISTFIPELRDLTVRQPPVAPGAARASVPSQRPITIRDLLTHTSGFVSGQLSTAEAEPLGPKAKETLSDVVPRLASVPLEFQPGTAWSYSGTYGFDVLARIIEVASGLRFDEFVQQRIFGPLAMRDTAFYRGDSNARVVTLYQQVDAALLRRPNPAHMNGVYFAGGGGLLSTAEDYLQFALMLLNSGERNGTRVLSPRSVELMASPFVPDTLPGRNPGEGFGLSVRIVTDPIKRNSSLSSGSYGWSGGNNTHFWIDPKEQLVGMFMMQTADLPLLPRFQSRDDFETAVMQAVIGPGTVAVAR
jgi:CubicO group peptidase (beta-lactamase class C family)